MFELNFIKIKTHGNIIQFLLRLVKIDSDKVIDLLLYKSHYALIKKLNVFLGDHQENFI